MFASVAEDAFLTRPIPLRHPPVFYEGHLPAFSYNKLGREALGLPSIDPVLELLFERGIDPATTTDASVHARADWPTRARVGEFGAAIDRALLDAIANAEIEDGDASPLLEGGEAVYTILEHEELHHETFLYLIAQLPVEAKQSPFAVAHVDSPASQAGRVDVPPGETTLGGSRREQTFGWDNEFDGATYEVPGFEIDVDPVTNGEYLTFVAAGGEIPPFWFQRDGEWWLRCTYDVVRLPLSWPVYATHDQARAFAAWRNARLPTEAEYQRAAYGSPDGAERCYPWGNEKPTAAHGNFNYRRFDPEPVGSTPAGTSAWGVRELVGNGWEWTDTAFAPLPGFRAMASYPQYSADFFDDRHYVVKGASPVTSSNLLRPSFRNWYYGDYRYMFAKFRTVGL